MRERFVALLAMLALIVVGALPALAIGGADQGEGQLAQVAYGSSAVEWNVFVEHEGVTLTVSTPCGVIQRAYAAGKNPFFSLEELSPDDPSGAYTWQIRIDPVVSDEARSTLEKYRGTEEEEDAVAYLRRNGLLPKGPFVQTGSFSVVEGRIVDPASGEEKGASRALPEGDGETLRVVGANAQTLEESIQHLFAETTISGNLTVYNSLCVGFDCLANETYGADTIRLKENNLRIHVEDTSGGSFPTTDWRLEFNSNLNGGLGYFRVIDATGNRNVMTIEAGAISNAIYADNGGRVGFGTSNPVLELHAANGDSPGLRLEQTTASGFAAQVWDIAGNETNFFVRDATNGSTLPFRVFPGSPSNSLVVRNGDVGMGTSSPETDLHIRDSGQIAFTLDRSDGAGTWSFTNNGNQFNISLSGTGANEFAVFDNGDVEARGTITGNIASPSAMALKTDFLPVDQKEVLAQLMELPIQQWRYKEGEGRSHIGPFAEEFSKAFQVGDSNRIFLVDANGVALAAIQGLNQIVSEKDARIQALEQRLEALEGLVSASADE